MVYLRVKARVIAPAGEPLTLGDVAILLADAKYRLGDLRVSLPKGTGVWQINALPLVVQIQEKLPDEVVNVLGDGIGYLHREAKRSTNGAEKRQLMRALLVLGLTVAACTALAVGHGAIFVYAAGVALGACAFSALQKAPPTAPARQNQRPIPPKRAQKQTL